MSRGYSKIYSRKLNNGSQASIQFDKLFHENSNRPSAAKSAGTIGRWGVISCTSLRSTNINGRRDEGLGGKRMRLDLAGRSTSSKDPFSFDTDGDAKVVGGAGQPPPAPKPKKFFKSRNIDTPQDDFLAGAAYRGPAAQQSSRKYSKSTTAAAKKFFPKAEPSEGLPVPVASPPQPSKSPVLPAREENKPPIVLRIFKGTSHLVNDVDVPSSAHHSSGKASSDGGSVIVRSSRRKNHVSSCSEYHVSVVNTSSRDSAHSSITSPKRELRERTGGRGAAAAAAAAMAAMAAAEAAEADEADSPPGPPRVPTPPPPTPPPPTPPPPTPPARELSPPPPAEEPVDDVERAVAALEAGDNLQLPAAVAPLSLVLAPPLAAALAVPELAATPPPAAPLAPAQLPSPPSSPLQESVVSDVERAAQHAELLLAGMGLATGTPDDPSLLSTTAPCSVPAVASSSQDWFSDSDGSNSILDQINSLAAEQAEGPEDLVMPKAEAAAPAEAAAVCAPSPVPEPLPEPEEKPELEPEPELALEGGRELRSGLRTASPATTRKGSIFKSRAATGGPRTRRAVYKHKWADTAEKEAGAGGAAAAGASTASRGGPSSDQAAAGGAGCASAGAGAAASTYMDDDQVLGRLTRVVSCPVPGVDIEFGELVTRVRCDRKDKEYYTVVRNVKKAHQIQESGEFQEFNDDVEYILDALQDNNPVGTRCLSAITLASKCMAPAFRMHVRAHGTVTKFFRALHDATKDQSLALCTATVMFVLSQDRLNMDLDRHSLELMLNLLESDASHRNALDDCGMSSAQLHKNKQKVRELCAEIQSQGHAKHLNLDNITAGHLAMETLLSLTSRRAGEWFKEELRELGGLEHIVRTVCDCCRHVGQLAGGQWTEPDLDQLRKVDRCLRVLENVTHQHEENQLYLLRYQDGVLVDTLLTLFCRCDAEIPLYPVTDDADKESAGAVIREALLATLKVLINLSHDFNNQSYGSTLVGERRGIVNTGLHVLLQVPRYVPEQKKFDLLVLALILLINLVEHSQANRKLLFEARVSSDDESIFDDRARSAVKVLLSLFYEQEQLARAEEVKTDAILDGKKDAEEPDAEATQPKSQEEFIEETVAKLLQKAGRNMEHTLIGAYIGLLLGYLIIDNQEYEAFVRCCLPEGNFKTIISVLQKVYNFMNLTASAVGSSRGIKQTERVINCLIQSDRLYAVAGEGAASSPLTSPPGPASEP